MRIHIYEHLTATRLGKNPASPEHGMYVEGRAMRDALAADFGRIPGVTLSEDADWTIFIAPPRELVALRLATKSRVLGPSVEALELTGNKLRTFQHWRAHGVPTPTTTLVAEPGAVKVLKPLYGAGSTDTFRIDDTTPFVLQEFAPGRAASVAFLVGPAGVVPLVPAFQYQSGDGRFHYRGGELPIPAPLAARAVSLGRRALECLPGLLGYVGVDLVLGDSAERDMAIEVNPRLTTSYLGLRALCEDNLAAAMLTVATGQDAPLRWKAGPVRFTATGELG